MRHSTSAKKLVLCAAAMALTTALVTAMSGCRSERRGVRVGAESATLKVTMSGLYAGDVSRPEWIYELSGCIGSLNGTHTGPSTVTFEGAGLKQGLTGCNLRVKTLQTTTGIKFAGEPGVYYWVKPENGMTLSQDADGNLSTIANLTPLYQVSGTAAAQFTLQVPVKFAAAEKGTVVTAAIGCTPAITSPGFFERAGDTDGQFVFQTEIAGEAAYACTALEVRVDGNPDARHTGTFAGETGKFKGKPGETVKAEVLALTPVVKKDDSIEVEATVEDCNKHGKVYNPETRECDPE